WLSAGFLIEEGFLIDDLREVVADMRKAADAAGVQIVTGDTKVVDSGAADGVYITTTGVGIVPAGRRLGADLVAPGDKVIMSGT
ncbi:hydrogenase expression/formation protein HypE, partial [Enterococcus hirae]